MLPGQLDHGLPQWLRQLRPSRQSAAKLTQLTLQLHDRSGIGSVLFRFTNPTLPGA